MLEPSIPWYLSRPRNDQQSTTNGSKAVVTLMVVRPKESKTDIKISLLRIMLDSYNEVPTELTI